MRSRVNVFRKPASHIEGFPFAHAEEAPLSRVVSKHDVGTRAPQATLRDVPWNCTGVAFDGLRTGSGVSGSPSHHFPKGIGYRVPALLAFAVCALGNPRQHVSVVDMDRDGSGDTVWMCVLSGKDNSETHLSVRPGRRGTEYRTVRIASARNFLSVIPLANPAPKDSFYGRFRAMVTDSLCRGFRYEKEPDNSLLWLLDSYSAATGDSVRHYTRRWGPLPTDFSPYYTLVSREQFPSLIAGLPPHLVHAERDSGRAAAVFATAEEFCVVYYMHNHCLSPDCVPEPAGTTRNVSLLKTRHAVIMEREGSCQWLFIADNLDRLRRPTVGRVVSTGRGLSIELQTVYERARVMLDTSNQSYRVVTTGTQ